VTFLVPCLAYSSVLKTEATSSETSVDFQQPLWHAIHNHRCANLRLYVTLLDCIILTCFVTSSDCEAVQYDLVVAVPELRRLVPGFPPQQPGFSPSSRHVGFVVDKMALGQVSSEYFGFLCQF
jgi:hypothetical protein